MNRVAISYYFGKRVYFLAAASQRLGYEFTQAAWSERKEDKWKIQMGQMQLVSERGVQMQLVSEKGPHFTSWSVIRVAIFTCSRSVFRGEIWRPAWWWQHIQAYERAPPPILYYMYDMETIPTWFKINHKVGGNTSVLTWIKLHKCPCKVHHVNKCYKQLYNLAQGHNTAISQENQNDPPMPLIWLQISNKLNHCFDQLST